MNFDFIFGVVGLTIPGILFCIAIPMFIKYSIEFLKLVKERDGYYLLKGVF